MLKNIQNKDIKTSGFVLHRTNYGEADRILNIITPLGKLSAIAKGVRREKSKLAGGVEIFTLSSFNIHFKNSELGVITSARMMSYYGNIVKSLDKIEVAAMILKKINKFAEGNDGEMFFDITKQCLDGLNNGMNNDLVEGWFTLKMMKVSGEEMNLYRDYKGEKLQAEERYSWDLAEAAFMRNENGEYGVNEIKMLRLMQSSDLNLVERIKADDILISKIISLIRVSSRL